MDGPDLKRLETSQERVESTAEQLSPFDMLPDEMLVEVFRNVDSVTRRNMESVCSRWKGILRDTHSLQKMIKIDVGILPPDTFMTPQEKQCDPSELLLATVRFLLNKYPDADTLHFTDVLDILAFDGNGSFEFMLTHLDGLLQRHGREDPGMVCVPRRILRLLTFDRLKLNSSCVATLLMDKMKPQFTTSCLYLHEVTLCGFTLDEVHCIRHDHCGTDWMDQTYGRKVTGCVRHVADQPTMLWQWIALVGEKDQPLDAADEVHFQRVMSGVRERDNNRHHVDELVDLLQHLTGHKPNRDDVLSGSAFPPFWKRLLISGEYYLKSIM